uniref:Uncharacterized protein n=1 Tax=viral metagenome TaxID=1070528 RepID=A0A6C0KE74_9ZZZZ
MFLSNVATFNSGSSTRGQKLIAQWVNSLAASPLALLNTDNNPKIYEPSSTKGSMRPSKVWKNFHPAVPYPHGTFVALERRDNLVYGLTYIVDEIHPIEAYPVVWQWVPTVCKIRK